MTPHEIQRLCEESAVVDLRSALRIFGIGEATGYRLARYRPEELPFTVLKVGRIYKVLTSSILAALELSRTEPDAALTA